MNLFIAMPSYDGRLSASAAIAFVDLERTRHTWGVNTTYFITHGESLVPRARNNCCAVFLQSDCTHMLFVDSDILFGPEEVYALAGMADDEHEIICAAYPLKKYEWGRVPGLAAAGCPPEQMPMHLTQSVVHHAERVERSRYMQSVKEAGNGFMLIARTALDKMAKAHPEIRYKPDYSIGDQRFDAAADKGYVHAFFDAAIVDGRYLSEDYAFCERWRNMGGKVWYCPWVRLGHQGQTTYRLAAGK